MGQPPTSREVQEKLRVSRHHHPHHQFGGSTYFVTFRSSRGLLPGAALLILREHLLHGHDTTHEIPFGVLMPDHVHLLIHPKPISDGLWHDLGKIMQGIKGGSSREINLALGTSGTVWQKESYDRIVRDAAEYEETWGYIYANPRRAGLVEDPDDDPFFVRPPEGAAGAGPTKVGPTGLIDSPGETR